MLNDTVAGSRIKRPCTEFSSMKVIDFLYCAYLFVVVLMSTMGMSASDSAYKLAVALGAVFAVIRYLGTKYDARSLFTALGIAGLAAVEFIVTKRFTLLLTALLIIGAKGLQPRILIKSFLVAKMVGLALLITLALLGIFEVEVTQYYKMAYDSVIQRVSINGAGTNVLHLSVIGAMFLYLYIKHGDCGFFVYGFFVLINVVCEFFTGSLMGLALGMGGLFLFFASSRWVCFRNFFIKYSTLVLPALLLFSFGTAALYGRNGLVDTLNRLFQGRIYYNQLLLNTQHAGLLGHEIQGVEANFDNSFVFVYVAYGLIVFFLLFGSVQFVIAKFKGKGDWASLALVVIYLVAGLSESFYPSAAVNPSLFLLVPLLSPLSTSYVTSKRLTQRYSGVCASSKRKLTEVGGR